MGPTTDIDKRQPLTLTEEGVVIQCYPLLTTVQEN